MPTLALRAVFLAYGVLAVMMFGPGWVFGTDILGVWNHWDAGHFLEVAAQGYGPPSDPARIVNYPLFPLLIRIVSIALPPVVAAMSITLVATVLAGIGLYRLVRLDEGPGTARAAFIAMSIFPTAFAFVAGYAESVFVALVVWSFLQARRGRWAAAGLLGMLAGATRVQGAFMLPALAIEYLVARRGIDRNVVWIAAVGLGPLAYLAINYFTFGNPLFFVQIAKERFFIDTVPPWHTIKGLVEGIQGSGLSGHSFTVYVAPLIALILLAVTALWTLRYVRRSPGYTVYTWLTLLSLSTLSWPLGVPRYLLGVFPMFIMLAQLHRSRAAPALAAGSVLALALFTAVFVIGGFAF